MKVGTLVLATAGTACALFDARILREESFAPGPCNQPSELPSLLRLDQPLIVPAGVVVAPDGSARAGRRAGEPN